MINRLLIRLLAMHCWVSTWMGDACGADKPSRYVTSHLGQLSLPSIHGRYFEYQLRLRPGVIPGQVVHTAEVKAGCDPIRQVTPRSCEMGFH